MIELATTKRCKVLKKAAKKSFLNFGHKSSKSCINKCYIHTILARAVLVNFAHKSFLCTKNASRLIHTRAYFILLICYVLRARIFLLYLCQMNETHKYVGILFHSQNVPILLRFRFNIFPFFAYMRFFVLFSRFACMVCCIVN